MPDESLVILDLSPETYSFLEQQGVNLFEEIQHEMPSARLELRTDPAAPSGSRDVVTVIAVASTLVSTLTPIILRILNMLTPPNRTHTWVVEDSLTNHTDGSVTFHRKHVLTNSEQRPSLEPNPKSSKEPSQPHKANENKE